jgi:hypothetical protein
VDFVVLRSRLLSELVADKQEPPVHNVVTDQPIRVMDTFPLTVRSSGAMKIKSAKRITPTLHGEWIFINGGYKILKGDNSTKRVGVVNVISIVDRDATRKKGGTRIMVFVIEQRSCSASAK